MTLCIFLFLVLGFPLVPHAVKVNMQGSLRLGKDVMETLSHYMMNNDYNLNGRRALSLNDVTSDTISLIVNSAFLCRDLNVCQGSLSQFVNDYVITLAKAVENKFEGLLQASSNSEIETKIPKAVIFEEEMKLVLQVVKRILNQANKKLEEDVNNTLIWVDLIKMINAKFQEIATKFASERLQGNAQDIDEVKQKLTQKIVIDTSLVELEYVQKLCTEEAICIKSYEVTKALKTLLKKLQELPDAKTKLFIRYFYETLPDTSFYYTISEVTSTEFQAILNDMAYAENIHTKNVLLAVEKTVDNRLNSINYRADNSTGRDVKLVNVILSDMDHFYSQHGVDPFHRFIEKFYGWTGSDARLNSPIRQVMRDVANTLSLESVELVTKLINEVRVFLEITVDPEK